MKQPLAFFVFQKHSIFIPFKYIYGECLSLIEDKEQLYPAHCLRNDHCPVNVGCMDVLAKRVNYLFTNVVPEGKQLIGYFKWQDRPQSIRAAIFNRDMREPLLMTLNHSAFKKFQREGISYTWVPPDEYLLIRPSSSLITVESLLVKPHDG
jgi:hypothetical protein